MVTGLVGRCPGFKLRILDDSLGAMTRLPWNRLSAWLIDWLCTKERAIEHALEQAREQLRWESDEAQALVIVERADHSEEQRVVVAPWQNAS